MAHSTFNPSVIVDVYPYPSNVNVSNFVSVKLSSRDKYNVWKTQMLCLLESHGMIGFIDGTFESPKDRPQTSISMVGDADCMRLWRRSDALVKGWILVSLSEQILGYVMDLFTPKLDLQTNKDFNAKNIWEELKRIYGPAVIRTKVPEELEWPCPSHVNVPNFVFVKLCGRDKYNVWKTQMLCLLESHGMLGFIDGSIASPSERVRVRSQNSVSGKEQVGGVEVADNNYARLWRRSDALVKGWILVTLSEQVLIYVMDIFTPKIHLHANINFTAKNVWEELRRIYGPVLHAGFQQEVEVKEESESELKVDSISEEAKTEEEEKKERAKTEEEEKKEKAKREAEERAKKELDEIANIHQRLYESVLEGNWSAVANVLETKKVRVTDRISINGNTALHVAVGTGKKQEFIKKMLELVPADSLSEKNSDGSTVLHVAAVVGNMDAARILVKIDPELLSAKDGDGWMPLARAISNMHIDMYLFLLKHTKTDGGKGKSTFAGKRGDELLVNAISSKKFGSARDLMSRYLTLSSDAVLMAIAQNFPSELNTWERRATSLVQKYGEMEGFHDVNLGIDYDYIKGCVCWSYLGLVILILIRAIKWLITMLPQLVMKILVWPLKFIQEKDEIHDDAMYLLRSACYLIKRSKHSNSLHLYYTNPVLEATKLNAYEFVEQLVSYFPNAIWCLNEEGHNIIQFAVINRSEKVYNLLYQMSEHKNIYKTIKDSSANNLLHLAARLAPANKLTLISGAALQIQRELQWFKEVEGFVCPLNIIQKNSFGETPEMVFTREHKDLVIEGEKWMKATAESYTITAALITTIVFAAAITVPGGNNQDSGIPIFTNNTAFTIFAVSDAISLFTSTTSLLMFLSILTARFAEQDFLLKLPTKLIIGLATLFISTTAMIVAFGATLFLMFGQNKSWILFPIAALTCLPITSFVTLQFPLIADLVSCTFGPSIFGKRRDRPFY